MTQSMTGFARASVATTSHSVIVELRSVNNRFLDLHFRCPENLRSQEPGWRRLLGKQFDRGKIEVAVRLQATGADQVWTVPEDRLTTLKSALDRVGGIFPEAGLPDRLGLLTAVAGEGGDQTTSDELLSATTTAMENAVADLLLQRQEEGAKLVAMVETRVASMREILAELRKRLPELREQQILRLRERLAQLDVEADGKRLEEELVYLAQRSDVDEEMDRLEAHLDAIIKAMGSGKPCGRRLDFLMQELNREANTLASKSTALSTTNTAVEFKVLIEQMREQIQNIE